MKAPRRDLVFMWHPTRLRSFLILPGFILFSFLIHALALYIFQVNYPASVSIAPPPVQVTLLSPSTPGYESLTRWIESENPARVISSPETTPPGLWQVAYKPSIARAEPKLVLEPNEPVRFPSAIHSLRGVPENLPSAANRNRDSVSSLHLSAAFTGRQIDGPITVHPSQKSSVPLKPTRFMAGMNDRGEVRYLFLEESSGDPAVDQWADRHFVQLNFAHATLPITWGEVTYSWGDDAYLHP